MFSHLVQHYNKLISSSQLFSGLAPLFFRLILGPVMIIAGFNKLNLSNEELDFFARLSADANVVAWFGNTEWGLGLPFPELLAFLAGWSEFLGGILLLLGLMTRAVAIPLMITMLVAATTVHMDNGWFAITPTNPDTSAAKVFHWLGFEAATASLENSKAAAERLALIKSIVADHGKPSYLYEKGNIAILNNGMEFSLSYFVMLLSLFFTGAGRYFSADYWLRRAFCNNR